MKKAVLILGGIILVLIAAFGAWYFFIRTSEAPLANTINNALPFGDGGENLPFSVIDTDPESPFGTNDEGAPIARLFQVSAVPVAGAVAIQKDNEIFIRYTERGTGHIIDANPRTLGKTKISNVTMPKIYESLWAPNGSSTIFRTTKAGSEQIDNTLVRLTPKATSTTDYVVETFLLRGDMGDVVVQNGALGYALRDNGVIATSLLDGTQPKALFTSPYTDWSLFWTDSSLIALTKPSAETPGYAYSVTGTGLKKILGPLNGLMILPSADQKRIAFSSISDTTFSFIVTNIDAESSIQIFPTTFPDKCAWSLEARNMLYCGTPTKGLQANEPDSWYQGISHYSDSIWKFDTTSNTSDLLIEPEKSYGLELDIDNPFLTPHEDYFIFTNKNDLTLWALKLD